MAYTRRGAGMKIIHINDVRIIMNSRTEYKIQTPLGILTDINDAVELYPYLTEDKKVRQCPICKRYFVKYGREDNAKKYCSSECAETYNRINKREINRMWTRDKYLRDKNTTIINDKANRSEVWEYHQNDNFWGLGSSHLYEKPKTDPEHEENAIKKELKRLGLRV
jgi:hypothetical protein